MNEHKRQYMREYNQSEAGKAVRAAYKARPEVKAKKKEIDARYARRKRAERDRERARLLEVERRRVASLVAKLRMGRYTVARKLAAATDEARRQHYRKLVADHDAELARLGVTP